MRAEFAAALTSNQEAFDIDLSTSGIERLADYFDLVQEHNPLLHLVAPCSPDEFAVRHILESLTLLEHLPQSAKLADVGAGAGLPSIPCLLVRDDLSAILIESKEKKANFLERQFEVLGLAKRAVVVNRQFEETDIGGCGYVTARALDKFTERLPRLLKWARRKKLLLFGGDTLGAELRKRKRDFAQELSPLSERRYLLTIDN